MDPDPDPDLQHYKDRGHNCGQYPGGGKGVGIYLLYYGINIAIVDISLSPHPPPVNKHAPSTPTIYRSLLRLTSL
jgi:hypothetical protein